MRILMIDNDRQVAESIELALTLFGHKVFTQANLQVGLNQIEGGEYDLIILNLSLLVLDDGTYTDLYRKARSIYVPIILLVEKSEIRKKARLRRHGVGTLIDIPVALGEILEAIERVSDRTQQMPVMLS